MGIEEQAGGMVAAVTDAMKSNPSCLAAVILAGMMALLTYFSLSEEQTRTHEREQENRRLMISLLNVCPMRALKDDMLFPDGRGDRP